MEGGRLVIVAYFVVVLLMLLGQVVRELGEVGTGVHVRVVLLLVAADGGAEAAVLPGAAKAATARGPASLLRFVVLSGILPNSTDSVTELERREKEIYINTGWVHKMTWLPLASLSLFSF